MTKLDRGEMSNFRNRLETMVETLRAHPEVEVYELVIRPPASDAALREAERVLGMPLPDDLRSFYAAHDGVFLEWGLRDDLDYNRTEPFDHPDYDQPPGCINLLPIAKAISAEWEQNCFVNQIRSEQQIQLFGAVPDPAPPFSATCIDNFSKYNHGDLIIGPEPVMIVSTDHGADMEASDFCSFATYLDMTLALWATSRYRYGIGVGWERPPARLDAWTKQPTLDEIVAQVLDDSE